MLVATNRRNPDICCKLYREAVAADAAWMAALKAANLGRPGDVRYTKAGEGQPGTALRAAFEDWTAKRAAWMEELNKPV